MNRKRLLLSFSLMTLTSTTMSQTVLATEAFLRADNPSSQINVRSQPTTQSDLLHYGLPGDAVQVLEEKLVGAYTWYRVEFPRSKAQGWVRGDLIRLGASVRKASRSFESQHGISRGVGKATCVNFRMRNPPENIRTISEATLSSRSGGKYSFRFVDDNGTYVMELNQKLSIESAKTAIDARGNHLDGRGRWNLVEYERSGSRPIEIKSNGDFEIGMAVSSRSACEFEGRVVFEGDVADRLFPSLR